MSNFEPSEYSSASSPPDGAVAVLNPGSNTRSFKIPQWSTLSHPKRLDILAKIGEQAAEDPRLRRLCVNIFRDAGVEPRDYRGQQAAILKFVSEKVFFTNEKDEVLQDPIYTLDLQADGTVGKGAHGDCDDFCTLLIALFRCIHFPAKPVISGRLKNGELVRYVHGIGKPAKAGWSHAYATVGPHPFKPVYNEATWAYADATLPNPKLGWDCVSQGFSDPQRGSNGLSGFLGDAGEVIQGASPRGVLTLIAIGVAVSLATDLARYSLHTTGVIPFSRTRQ